MQIHRLNGMGLPAHIELTEEERKSLHKAAMEYIAEMRFTDFNGCVSMMVAVTPNQYEFSPKKLKEILLKLWDFINDDLKKSLLDIL